MSEEQINAFLEKVKADTSLQEKLKAATSPEAAIEIAKEAGFAITAEDIQSMQSATVEVSDEELEGAAGGFMITPITPYIRPQPMPMGKFVYTSVQSPCHWND